MSADPHRSDRVGRSVLPRIVVGLVVGSLVGGAIGFLIGLLVFDGSRARWAGLLAGAIFVGILGAFWGGMTGLGPPAPEDDPLPRARPGDVGTRSSDDASSDPEDGGTETRRPSASGG